MPQVKIITRITDLKARAAKSLRQNGIKGAIVRVLLSSLIYRRVLLSDRDLTQPIPEVSAKLPIDIALLKPDEIGELVAFCERNFPTLTPTEIRNRLDSGQVCFVARYNGRIVHASWAAFQVFHMPFLRMRYLLKPDEAYLYDMHTDPEFRNQHVARARVAWTLAYLRDVGYKRAISDVFVENKASQASADPLGFRTFGLLARIIIGPIRITSYKPYPVNPIGSASSSVA